MRSAIVQRAEGTSMRKIGATALFAMLTIVVTAGSANAQRRTVRPAACSPAPTLALSPDFRDTRRRFAAGSPALRATARNFNIAYRRSCALGLLRGVSWRRLFLRNNPSANDPIILQYRRRLVLENAFLQDGVNIPSADELAEAIYCHVRGATRREQEVDGRCLPD